MSDSQSDSAGFPSSLYSDTHGHCTHTGYMRACAHTHTHTSTSFSQGHKGKKVFFLKSDPVKPVYMSNVSCIQCMFSILNLSKQLCKTLNTLFLKKKQTKKNLFWSKNIYFVTFSYTTPLQNIIIHCRNDNNNKMINCKIIYRFIYSISKIHCIYKVAHFP